MMLTFSSLLFQILLFVYRIIITRFSGAGGMGIYQLAMPYYSILSSISLAGITMAVTRLTVEKSAVGDTKSSHAVTQTAIRMFLTLLTISAVITFMFPDFVAGKILGDIRTKLSMLLFIPCLFFTGFENIYKSFFFGAKHLKPNIISENTELSIRICAIFILLYMNKSSLTPEKTAFLIVFGMIISEIFSFTFLGIYYKIYQKKQAAHGIFVPASSQTAPKYKRKKKIFSEIVRIAVPISASSILMTIISSANTILIPQRLVASGMTQTEAIDILGILMGMTYPLVTLPLIFIGPLMNVIFPRIASAQKLGDMEDMKNKITKTLQTSSFLTFPAMGAVAALGQPLCMLMYRNETAGKYIIPLMISSVFSYIQIVTGNVLYALDKQKNLAVYNIIDGIIHVVCTYIFVAVPSLNVYGFMIGNFVSSFIGTVLNFVTVKKYANFKFHLADFSQWFILPAFAGVYTGFMTYFTYNFCLRFAISPLFSVIIALLFSIVIYIAVLELRNISVVKYILRLRKSE